MIPASKSNLYISKMRQKPQIVSTQILARTKLFKIEQVELHFSNGAVRHFERLCPVRHGAVMIIPMLDDNTVLLIREYAAGVDRYELSLPKGILEENESVEDAANRELMEEVGYGAKDLRQLKMLNTSPGYMSSGMKLVLARDLYEKRLPGDEPEEIEVVPWRLDQLKELFEREDFSEARSAAALLMIREKMF